MKYYTDFEFSEHFKLGFNLRYYHTIELIQIGIKAEDGRTYTAINKNFNPRHANDFVKNKVLPQIILNYRATRFGQELIDLDAELEGNSIEKNFRYLQRLVGKSQKEIASDVFDFVNPDLGWPVAAYNNSDFKDPNSAHSKYFDLHNVDIVKDHYYAHPTFVGYFCDYDWVLFCSLFGTMMDLPPGFPMYMVDLKQKLDEIVLSRLPEKHTIVDFEKELQEIKEHSDYPKQTNEHDALADAEWNHELNRFIDFLNNIQKFQKA